MTVMRLYQNENHTTGFASSRERWCTPCQSRVAQWCLGRAGDSALEQDAKGVSRTGKAISLDRGATLSMLLPYPVRKFFPNRSK
jgi:hypothetical protein